MTINTDYSSIKHLFRSSLLYFILFHSFWTIITNFIPVITYATGEHLAYEVNFGADIGYVWSNGNPGSLSTRCSKLTEDHMYVVRYSAYDGGIDDATTSGTYLNTFVSTCSNYNIKVIAIIPAYNNNYKPGGKSASQWADAVYITLNSASTYISNGTIIGIEIGGEEDELHKVSSNPDVWEPSWNPGTDPTNPFYHFTAGQNFAPYYVAVRDRIRANQSWNNLQILSWGISKHDTLSMLDKPGYEGMGQYAQAFFRGFLYQVINGLGGISKLPNVLTMHGYEGYNPPESIHDSTTGKTGWINRLNSLRSICSSFGYTPNYGITEQAFSPVDDDVNPYAWACDPADERTQAIYYLRRALMNSDMQSNQGDEWSCSIYWQYAYNDSTALPRTNSTGWFKDTSFGNRAIRKVGQILHGVDSSYPGLNTDYTDYFAATSTSFGSGNYIMKLGWVNNISGYKWVALWKYYRRSIALDDFELSDPIASYGCQISDANAPLYAYVFKFNFTSTYSYNNTTWSYKNQKINRELVTGTLYNYTITNNLVDGNPTFLLLSNNPNLY